MITKRFLGRPCAALGKRTDEEQNKMGESAIKEGVVLYHPSSKVPAIFMYKKVEMVNDLLTT